LILAQAAHDWPLLSRTNFCIRPILLQKLGIEFVLGPFSELEVLARGKAKTEGSGTEADLPMETAA
jgi:hypothetical protein